MLQKAIPLLPSDNLRATVDFYETRLQFTGTNMGNYAILRSGKAELHFYLVDKKDLHTAACIICTDNLEDLYTNFAARDMLYPKGKIEELSSGKKEFWIQDNNGNRVKFVRQSN